MGKRFIVLVAIIVIIAIVSGFIFIMNLSDSVRDESQNYLHEVAVLSSVMIGDKFESDLQTVESMALILSGKNEKEFHDCVASLKRRGVFNNFQRTAVIHPDGRGYTGDNIEELDFSTREYFQKALAGKSNISEMFYDNISGEMAIVYAVPIIENDKVVGVVAALAYESTYQNILKSDIFGGSGYSYIVSQDGSAIVRSSHADSDHAFVNMYNIIEATDEEKNKMLSNMRDGHSGTLTYHARGKMRVLSYAPLHINGWYLVSVVPYQIISEKTKYFTLLIVIQSLIITIAVFILILYILLMEKKAKKALYQLAYFDELTGARNLNKFKTDASALLAASPNVIYTIIKLDIDKFKFLNELFGFAIGDAVLKNVATAIDEAINPETDIFARVSSDEFVIFILYKGAEVREEMRLHFESIFYKLMGKNFKYKIYFPTGRYVLEQGETNMPQIFEKVNMAHRLAKLDINVQFVDYDDTMRRDALREQDIENKMDQALQMGEYQLYLQPKYLLLNEKMVGAEALVRWKTQSGEMIFPNTFIPVFEKNGFITKLDFYMFEKACRIIRNWIDMGLEPIAISVNFSRLHLNRPGFVHELCRIADLYGVHRMYLEVELTETTLFEHGDILIDFFTEIHKAGFTVSMDDFGTGYSSLGMLKNLPVDVVKIDRSFFVDAIDEERVKAVMSCIIDMTKRLGIHTVAEGVETVEHIELLKELGCDIVQGYYYSKPMPAAELTEQLKKRD